MQVLVYSHPGQTVLAPRARSALRGAHEAGHTRHCVHADSVLVSCITACGRCNACARGLFLECTNPASRAGPRPAARHAPESVRRPHPLARLAPAPLAVNERALVMLSDLLPYGFDAGLLDGLVRAGSQIAIVGAGPAGLATLLTAQLHAPAGIILIDPDQRRLALGRLLGATAIVNSVSPSGAAQLEKLTGGRGADTVIETLGGAAVSSFCADILAPGGTVASVMAQGRGDFDLQLEKLWTLLDQLLRHAWLPQPPVVCPM